MQLKVQAGVNYYLVYSKLKRHNQQLKCKYLCFETHELYSTVDEADEKQRVRFDEAYKLHERTKQF